MCPAWTSPPHSSTSFEGGGDDGDSGSTSNTSNVPSFALPVLVLVSSTNLHEHVDSINNVAHNSSDAQAHALALVDTYVLYPDKGGYYTVL